MNTHLPVASKPKPAPRVSPAPVRHGILQRKCACGGSPGADGECEECRQKRIQRKAGGIGLPGGFAPPVVHDVLRSPGQPLDAATRAFMEPRFGHDFSRVRIHTDAQAAHSARSVDALAYTVGSHIVFQPEYFDGKSAQGRKLLAHELSHVLQQGHGAPLLQRAESTGNEPIRTSSVTQAMLSRQDPPYPGAISYCRGIGVPCPAPHFHHGTFCRLVTCRRATTAGLPFAISPGVCIYQCGDGQICACVLLGTATSAVCAMTFCDSAAQASNESDYDQLASKALAMAASQQSGGEQQPAGGAPSGPGPTMQAKLRIGESGDAYEREADSIANTVMAMSPTRSRGEAVQAGAGSGTMLQRVAADGQGSRSTLPYRQAVDLAECVRIMGDKNSDYCRQTVLGEAPDASAPATPPSPSCLPARPLTWADFTGRPSGRFSAFTSYTYPTVGTGSTARIQATFKASASFVQPQFGNPANARLNGCAANVSQCQRNFPPGNVGGSFALGSTPNAQCPASVTADPTVVATSSGDCSGAIAMECQRVSQAESDRLLAHEQLHLDIACVLASKANAALAGGAKLSTIQRALNATDSRTVHDYDTQTNHSCLPGPQAAWAADVAAGLPNVTIP